ncbi:ATP-dependent RNA helicase MSS116, partial [Metarhizium majus ARSEF 297]
MSSASPAPLLPEPSDKLSRPASPDSPVLAKRALDRSPSDRAGKRAKGRTNKCTWNEARNPYEERGEKARDNSYHEIWYCKHCDSTKKPNSVTTNLSRARKHLRDFHGIRVVEQLERSDLKKQQHGTIMDMFGTQEERQANRDIVEEKHLANAINIPAFEEALARLLAVRNIAHTFIEYPEFHAVILSCNYMDRLLDMGFVPALREIVSKLPDKKQVPRQSMLFSATIAERVNKVAGLVLSTGYKFISTIPEGEANTHERVPQVLITVPTFASVAAGMVGAIREEASKHDNFKAIVFAPTAAQAGFYGHVLSRIPGLPPVSTLHGRMTQNKRTKITNDYREAPSAILTATDVIARGMDFPGVTTVFQIGIPSEKESYIHRLGRTARANAGGRGIFLICEAESFFPKWTLKNFTFIPHEADLSFADEVERILDTIDEDQKAQIYQAWLGYYNNHMKGLRWDKTELVRQANIFARDGLGTPETPPIQKGVVGKMGLRGTRGLNVVPDKPRGRTTRGGR